MLSGTTVCPRKKPRELITFLEELKFHSRLKTSTKVPLQTMNSDNILETSTEQDLVAHSSTIEFTMQTLMSLDQVVDSTANDNPMPTSENPDRADLLESAQSSSNDSQISVSNSSRNRISVLDMSPLPKAGPSGPRKRKAQTAELITSTPFKRKLEIEKKTKDDKEARIRERAAKKKLDLRKLTEPKVKKSRCNPKHRPNAKPSVTDDVQYYCLYCKELFVDPPKETWIQCTKCLLWCHESCVAPEGGKFVCDFCM